jgi:AcrR family transcriptional regulator
MRLNPDTHAATTAAGARRPRGRPRVRADETTLRLLVEAAAQEFQANGYAATCIADVARRAGVSTKTLYRLIPTKAELFRRVLGERTGRFVLELDADALDYDQPAGVLERVLIAYATLTLENRTIAMNRLVLGECANFPEIASSFYQDAILRTGNAMESFLRRLCERGAIVLDDPQEATGLLRGMMIMEPQRAAMLGLHDTPNEREIARRAQRCARLFLDGCAARQASARASSFADQLTSQSVSKS